MFKLCIRVIFSRLVKSPMVYIIILPKRQNAWRHSEIVKCIYMDGNKKLVLYCTFCLSLLPWFSLWKSLLIAVRTCSCSKLNYVLLWPGCYESWLGTDGGQRNSRLTHAVIPVPAVTPPLVLFEKKPNCTIWKICRV